MLGQEAEIMIFHFYCSIIATREVLLRLRALAYRRNMGGKGKTNKQKTESLAAKISLFSKGL
jgi:hypothetical protein